MKKNYAEQSYFEKKEENLITPDVLINFFDFKKCDDNRFVLEIHDWYFLWISEQDGYFYPLIEEFGINDTSQEVQLPEIKRIHELEYLLNYLINHKVTIEAANRARLDSGKTVELTKTILKKIYEKIPHGGIKIICKKNDFNRVSFQQSCRDKIPSRRQKEFIIAILNYFKHENMKNKQKQNELIEIISRLDNIL